MNKKNVPVCQLPVMQACCKSCPFRLADGIRYQDVDTAIAVIERTLFKAQQICHGTEGKKRQPRNRCKGAYDYNYTIYERLGLAHLLQ